MGGHALGRGLKLSTASNKCVKSAEIVTILQLFLTLQYAKHFLRRLFESIEGGE